MLVSTKTGAVMGLLARQIPASAPQKGFPRQRPPHSAFVGSLFAHVVLQYARQEPRDTGVSARRFQPCPARHPFLERDRDISQLGSHDTNLVYHGFGVEKLWPLFSFVGRPSTPTNSQ